MLDLTGICGQGPRIIELIATTERIGLGRDGDPVRFLYQLYTLDGKKVASQDLWKEERKEASG